MILKHLLYVKTCFYDANYGYLYIRKIDKQMLACMLIQTLNCHDLVLTALTLSRRITR